MRFSHFFAGALCLVLIGSSGRLAAQATAPAPAASAAISGPIIDFDSRTYEFGKAPAGEFVKHVFTVTNSGTEELEISNVHPACGCTTAGDWTRKIEPGQTGKIPIQFNSSHYNGPVTKTIDVTSNAKNQSRATLVIKGTIWKPVDIIPQSAVINVQADDTNIASTTVKIVNHSDSDLTLSDATSSSQSFTAEIKTVTPGKEFQVVVTAHPPFAAGNSPATISLKTSLSNASTLSITAIASVQAAVQVAPAQITLTGYTDHWTTNRVLIHGNGNSATNLLLEDPKSSDSRIQVELVRLGTHNMYNLLAAVPPGFELAKGAPTQITVKSNHPRYPLLTIPVRQLPRSRGVAGQSSVSPGLKQAGIPAPPPPHP
jgi:hypothetical protein